MSILSDEPSSVQSHLMVHFVLGDGSHQMDALVLNSCEGDLLGLIKELAKQLSADVEIQVKAYGEGGIEIYLTFIEKHAKALGLIGTLVTAILSAGVWITYQSKLLDQQIETNRFTLERDRTLSAQQIEQNEINLKKSRLELKRLEQEAAAETPRLPATDSTLSLHLEGPPTAEALLPALLSDRRILKLRSRFYEELLRYDKVSAVGFAPLHKPRRDEERMVLRRAFHQFVIHLEELEPVVFPRAEIEIIAPVLIRDGGKWRGRFEGRVISFYIEDEGFLGQVANKRVRFQNGTTLVCRLRIHFKEDDAGAIDAHKYFVEQVLLRYSRPAAVAVPHRSRQNSSKSDPRANAEISIGDPDQFPLLPSDGAG